MFTGGIPYFCGGRSALGDSTLECFKMDLTTLEWFIDGFLPDGLFTSEAGYDHSPEWGLLMSGGVDSDFNSTGTVLRTMDGSQFDHLPELPETSQGHCLTIIDDTRFLVAGGSLQTTYIWDDNQSQWTDIGPIPSGSNYYVSCGVVRDPESDAPLKVVVAGVGSKNGVDIYNLETNNWEDGGKYSNMDNHFKK